LALDWMVNQKKQDKKRRRVYVAASDII